MEAASERPAGRRSFACTRRERREDRIESLDDRLLAADHQAVAAFESPDAAAGADVDVVDLLRGELGGAAKIVDVVRVAAVDEDIVRLEQRQQLGDHRIDDGRRNHQPNRTGFGELLDEVGERRGPQHRLLDKSLHHLRRLVEDHALMPAGDQPPHHVRAHPTQTDHSQLHGSLLEDAPPTIAVGDGASVNACLVRGTRKRPICEKTGPTCKVRLRVRSKIHHLRCQHSTPWKAAQTLPARQYETVAKA